VEVIDALQYLFEPSGLVTDVLNTFGRWVYAVIFAIVFAETGLVFTPFLPGDSLLFAAGTVAGAGSLGLWFTATAVTAGAIVGDAANYAVGRWFGRRLAARFPRRVSSRHLVAAQAFFERHGGRAIFLARFVPLVRTFAPFVAGMSAMPVRRFWLFNISGALAWVTVFLISGYFFGQIKWVAENLTLAVILVMVVSSIPIAVGAWRKWRRKRRVPVVRAES
jgi:membrane-associated protein